MELPADLPPPTERQRELYTAFIHLLQTHDVEFGITMLHSMFMAMQYCSIDVEAVARWAEIQTAKHLPRA